MSEFRTGPQWRRVRSRSSARACSSAWSRASCGSVRVPCVRSRVWDFGICWDDAHSVGGSLGRSLSPLPASSPIKPPARVISIGDKTPHASASFGLCSIGCTTKRSPKMSDAIAMTKDAVKPIPTMRISRALICSLLRRLSVVMRSVFLVFRWLWWCCSFLGSGQHKRLKQVRA